LQRGLDRKINRPTDLPGRAKSAGLSAVADADRRSNARAICAYEAAIARLIGRSAGLAPFKIFIHEGGSPPRLHSA
jgi:hypothetical protein